MQLSAFLTGALAVSLVAAHPGEDHHHEAVERRAFLEHITRRDLGHCTEKLKARGHHARSIQRRTELVNRLSKRGALIGRDLDSLLKVSHKSSKAYTSSTPESTVFSGNNSCVLSPEVTEGPYYVAGEYVRRNVVESQAGVPLHLDVQVIDMATCKPVDGAYLEIWHCNSTGVYSGVSANGNGNSATDKSNLNATFLRGVQLTDADGAAQFDTLFPGHYTGRTNHIHVMVHLGATPLANGTLRSTTASHVGQMFFDQSLVSAVEAVSPYSANTQTLTTNSQDSILASEADGSDPFLEYVYLGQGVEDGLFGWLGFGIDTSMAKNVSAASTLYASGGKTNPNAGMGPPPGDAPGAPNGTATASGTGTGTGTALTSTATSGARRMAYRFWI